MPSPQYKHAPAMINAKLTVYYDVFVDLFLVGKALQKRSVSILPLKPQERFLDIGCGTGTLACLAKTKYKDANVYAADADQIVLKLAAKKAAHKNLAINFVCAGAEKLPFPDGSFDTVTSSLAFHHMPLTIKRAALLEIKRVLKPSGTFLLVDIGKPKNFFWKIIYYLESMVEPKEYIKDNLEGLLPGLMAEAGFLVSEARKSYLGINFWLGKQKEL